MSSDLMFRKTLTSHPEAVFNKNNNHNHNHLSFILRYTQLSDHQTIRSLKLLGHNGLWIISDFTAVELMQQARKVIWIAVDPL